MADTIYIVAAMVDERARLESELAAISCDVRAFDTASALLAVASPPASGCVVAPADLPAPGVRFLIDELRRCRSPIGVVVLGRDDDLRAAVDFIRAGAAEFVEHPLAPRRLLSAVRRALAAAKVRSGAA